MVKRVNLRTKKEMPLHTHFKTIMSITKVVMTNVTRRLSCLFLNVSKNDFYKF